MNVARNTHILLPMYVNMKWKRPRLSTNRDFAEPTTVYFPESYAESLSSGHEMAVPCGRAIAIKPESPETSEMHAEVFFVVTYRPKWVWWHKSENFPMETKKTENGMWMWKSIPR